jgi:hypothetical protein
VTLYKVINLLKKKSMSRKTMIRLGVVVHTCDLSTEEYEAGRSQVQGQSELHIENLVSKKKRTK